jgi:hypothetical protein
MLHAEVERSEAVMWRLSSEVKLQWRNDEGVRTAFGWVSGYSRNGKVRTPLRTPSDLLTPSVAKPQDRCERGVQSHSCIVAQLLLLLQANGETRL